MHVDPRGASYIASLNARRLLRPCLQEKKWGPTIKPPTKSTTSSLTSSVVVTPSAEIVLAHHHTARQVIRLKAWAGGRVGAAPCKLPTPPTPTTEPHSSRHPTAALPCSCTASDAWQAGAGRCAVAIGRRPRVAKFLDGVDKRVVSIHVAVSRLASGDQR